MKTAIILSNMGGPDSLEAVQPYLANIFSDPDIIDIPLPNRWRGRFARWLAKRRSPESREIYRQIGGKSPLTEITVQQTQLLESKLNEQSRDTFAVFAAMRYWHPFIEDVWGQVIARNFERLIVVSLYPFYSKVTSGSLVNLIHRLQERQPFAGEPPHIIDRFGTQSAFIHSMAQQIMRAISAAGKQEGETTDVLLSAHSIPQKLVKNGDPYCDEIGQAVEALRKILPGNIRLHLAFQSKIGPVKWLEPATLDKITALANQEVKELFVYPLGFVADNSETLYEIGMLYKNIALQKGIEKFIRIEALNTDDLFIEALQEMIGHNITW